MDLVSLIGEIINLEPNDKTVFILENPFLKLNIPLAILIWSVTTTIASVDIGLMDKE